jgi:hypothetical protein
MEKFEKIVNVVEFEKDLVSVARKHNLQICLYRYDKEKWGKGEAHKITLMLQVK